jgi:ABC-type Fe3+/spermidine/putrescine transport system ATPase subunit
LIRVTIESLLKRFDKVAVVDHASLEVRPGELAFLLGPSGAGKTTLARVVAGLEEADEGEIYFEGRIIHTLPAAERRVGLVFQDDALWPHMTVAENVGYGLRVRGMTRSERRERVQEILGTVGIDSLADRRPAALAPLQRLRVALARAMVIEPELLILDEPLARLEPRARPEFRDELRRLHAETETSTLVLTSDPREALAMADRLAVIDLGRVIQVGPPADVYNRPADTFVARFLGPTNLIHGQVEGTDARGDLIVRTPLGRLIGQSTSGPLPSGAPVTLAIRPESISLGPTVPAGANRFAATLERQTFLGEVRQVDLRGPGDWPVSALALQGQSGGLREGQGVTASVSPELVVILPGKFAGRTDGG